MPYGSNWRHGESSGEAVSIVRSNISRWALHDRSMRGPPTSVWGEVGGRVLQGGRAVRGRPQLEDLKRLIWRNEGEQFGSSFNLSAQR
jgi:hypothetical protein